MTSPNSPVRVSSSIMPTDHDIDCIELLNDTLFPIEECLKKACVDKKSRLRIMDSIPMDKFGNPEIDEWISDIDFMLRLKKHVATTIVQKCWRGYSIRCKYVTVRHYKITQNTSIHTIPADLNDLKENRDLDHLMKLYAKYEQYAKIHDKWGQLPPNFVDFCASKIRATYLAHKTQKIALIKENVRLRKSKKPKKRLDALSKSDMDSNYVTFLHHDMEDDETDSVDSVFVAGDHPDDYVPPPTRIQRQDSLVRLVDDFDLPQNAMAKRVEKVVKIQRWYQGIMAHRVYRYYKDLIKTKEKANPRTVLRFINPTEASYLDDACSIYIRFRLGGHQFPPTIFYKIFMHDGMVDMNSFSPRDYVKQPIINFQGEKTKHSGWYQRDDNNGWRPIQSNFAKDYYIYRNYVELCNRTLKSFHSSKLIRREEANRLKRMKKIEWLKRIYQQVLENEPPLMPDEMDDMEINELLGWVKGLDFDEYSENWLMMATTGISRRFIEEIEDNNETVSFISEHDFWSA